MFNFAEPLKRILNGTPQFRRNEAPSQQDESTISQEIKDHFRPAVESGVKEILGLYPEAGKKKAELIDRCLETIVGWSFPFRQLLPKESYEKYSNELRFLFVFDERPYSVSTQNTDGHPGLVFNLKQMLPDTLPIQDTDNPNKLHLLSTAKYMRLAGVEEGSHTLVDFEVNDSIKSNLSDGYLPGTKFATSDLLSFYRQPKERRADYLKARYVRLYFSEDEEVQQLKLHDYFLRHTRPRS